MMKKLVKLLLGLILLSVIAGIILLMSVNTEQNKAAIQAAVLSSTGYELTIAGDIDIALFPNIGLTLNDVRLKNPASPQELASTAAVLLQVDLRSLIRGEILVRELSTNDAHINYYVNAAGKSNWDVAVDNPPATAAPQATQQQNEPASDGANSDSITVAFEHFQIDNASIDIQDLSQGLRYSVKGISLKSKNVNMEGRAFNVDVNFTFLNNGMSKPIAMNFRGDISADINTGNIDVENIHFNITPLLLQGDLHISGLKDDIAFDGSLTSNNFDVLGLLQSTGFRETNTELDATSSLFSTIRNPQANIEAAFNGNKSGIKVSRLSTQLSDSKIDAEAELRFATDFSPAYISYEIVSNQIDISPFLNSESPIETDSEVTASNASSSTSQTPNSTTDVAVSFDFLKSFNVLGSIAIDSVVANDLLFTGINIFTNIEDGVLDIELQPVTAFEGNIAANRRVDARGEEAALNTQLAIKQLNLAGLLPSTSRFNAVTGKLNVESELTASGQTTDQLIDSLNGLTNFAISENSVDIGVIKQVFTDISALSPSGGTIEQWPDVIRFAEFGGFILLNDGFGENQQLNLRMDNFDISGTGGINIEQQEFDYELQFTILGEPYLQSIKVDELYHDIAWPVKCAAALEDEFSQYCQPDFTKVREIIAQLGSNAVIERLDEVIDEKLPSEVGDGVRGLLRNLFQ